MMKLRTATTLLTALVAFAAPAGAQAQDRSVYPGDRVRITDAARWTGMVQGVSPDTMDVVPDGERSARPVAFAAVRQVEISLGEKGRGRPFLIGAVAGAGLAAGTAAIVSEVHTCDTHPDQFGFTPFCETVGPVAMVASALIGFAAGGAVGALFGGGENWVRATVPARGAAAGAQTYPAR